MPIKITNTTITVENYLELEELCCNMEERLTKYSKKHKDFTVVLEKNIEDNELLIKTLYLEEHIN